MAQEIPSAHQEGKSSGIKKNENIYLDMEAIAKAKVAAIKKGFNPDLAGNTSALLRYLIADFTAKSGK